MPAHIDPVSVVTIECDLGLDPPTLYCPRTGTLVFRAEDSPERPASPYVTFVHQSECDEFIYLRDDLAERLDEARAAIARAAPDDEYESTDDVPYDLDTLREHVTLGAVPMIYEIKSKYIANGPVQVVTTIGFDVWPLSEQEEDDEALV